MNWLKQNVVTFLTIVTVFLILLNSVFIYSIRLQLKDILYDQDVTAPIGKHTINFLENLLSTETQAGDFFLRKDEASLKAYENSLVPLKANYDSLNKSLVGAGDTSIFAEIELKDILDHHDQLLERVKQTANDSINVKLVNSYSKNKSLSRLLQTLANKQSAANKVVFDLNDQLNICLLLQVGLLISIPFIFWSSVSRNTNFNKLKLLVSQTLSSSKYVFDSNDQGLEDNPGKLLSGNLTQASEFISMISKGKFDVEWKGFDKSNTVKNSQTIAGSLLSLRDQMKNLQEETKARMWVSEGLSKVNEIIRQHQDNLKELSNDSLSFVIKYLNAQLGGLFIVAEGEGDEADRVLALEACYAYDLKKFISNNIEIGQGIVGQVFLEGETTYLKQVPQDYLKITSGLGQLNPTSVIIVPLKVNDKVEGVIEIGSFCEFQSFEIEFIEKLGEILAASIISVRAAQKTKVLLQLSQSQTEEMRAQEEEMRQNMEELEATQEQLTRQMTELTSLKHSLEQEKYLFNSLMDALPYSIYFKDKACKLIRVSKHMADAFGVSSGNLIGKSDFDFQDEAHARAAFNDEQEIIRTKVPKLDYEEMELRSDGSEIWVSTTKMPLLNIAGEPVGTFGISRDISIVKQLEKDLILTKKLLQACEQKITDKHAKG